MLLLGHRGARRHAPENTLAAFDLALAHGCAGFEFDVRSSADARAVICHDGDHCGVKIATSRYDALLAAGPALALLDNVLARYAARAYLDIELKAAGAEPATVALLRDHP